MKKGTKGQRGKGAKVVNMNREGEIQCPLCFKFFNIVGKESLTGTVECVYCGQTIGFDHSSLELAYTIAAWSTPESFKIEDVIIKRVQWHLDVPVCRILAGLKIHIAALGLKERMWLFYLLGCETADELANIMWQLIRLQKKHKRSLKAA